MMNMKHIELRHLRYFIRVAEELHFGRAAERLGMAQAPLSQQIQQLEERLGVRLLERTTRQVRLSAAGSIFLDHARRTITDLESGVEAVRSAGGNDIGPLRIGTVYIAIYRLLPQIIRRFHQRYPKVEIDIRVGRTEEHIELIGKRQIDVAFLRPPKTPADLSIERIFSEGFVAALPKEHPLAARSHLTLIELRDENFLINAPILGVGYQELFLQHCRLAGFRPRIAHEASEALAIVTLVAAGMGIGVVPAWLTFMPHPEVVYRPVRDLPVAIDLALAWSSDDLSRFVRHFISITREVTRGLRSKGSIR